MLTPAFEVTQSSTFITIVIHARFAKVAETEIFIQDEEFKFYSKPYFLRLNLPGKLVEDGRESAKYDVESGIFTVQIPKLNEHEHFEGLDMITKLLAPKGNTSAKAPLIEVLDSTDNPENDSNVVDEVTNDENDDEWDDEDFDWQIDQVPYKAPEESSNGGSYKYGFANQRSGVFDRLQDELHGVIDLSSPENASYEERTTRRVEEENNQFDCEHYLADLYEDDTIQEILKYKPLWVKQYRRLKNGQNPTKIVQFTDEERLKLKDLPNKEFDEKQTIGVFMGLVDVIYAYAYNHRTTEGEENVESAWNIRKLSATLSWLETYSNTSMKTVTTTCYRRALSYPLYRHWKLCQKVFRDTQKLFSLGRRRLLQCLLEIHSSLNQSDPYYILNDLYVTDYCVWIQSVSEKKLVSLARSLSKVKIEKEDLGLELIELELAAKLAEEEARVEELQTEMAAVSIQEAHTAQKCDEEDENTRLTVDEIGEKIGALSVSENVIGSETSNSTESCPEGRLNTNLNDGDSPTCVAQTLFTSEHTAVMSTCKSGTEQSKKILITVISEENETPSCAASLEENVTPGSEPTCTQCRLISDGKCEEALRRGKDYTGVASTSKPNGEKTRICVCRCDPSVSLDSKTTNAEVRRVNEDEPRCDSTVRPNTVVAATEDEHSIQQDDTSTSGETCSETDSTDSDSSSEESDTETSSEDESNKEQASSS